MDRAVRTVHDQLRRAFEGPAWHGPSLRAVLAELSAATAAARPVSGVHSIWEIVLHVTAWKTFMRRRLGGESITSVATAEDWPPVTQKTEAAWGRALAALEDAQGALLGAVAGVATSQLDHALASEPGTTETVHTSVLGLVQHDLYHAGQIAILRRAAESTSRSATSRDMS